MIQIALTMLHSSSIINNTDCVDRIYCRFLRYINLRLYASQKESDEKSYLYFCFTKLVFYSVLLFPSYTRPKHYFDLRRFCNFFDQTCIFGNLTLDATRDIAKNVNSVFGSFLLSVFAPSVCARAEIGL